MNPEDPQGAATGVADPALAELLREQWDGQMARWPEWASMLGDHRFDDRLGGRAPEDYRADVTALRGWLRRAEALGERPLDEADQLTLEVLRAELGLALDEAACHNERWTVNSNDTPVGLASRLAELTPVHGATHAEDLLTRYLALPGVVDGWLACLREGAAAGLFAQRGSVQRTIALVDGALAEDPARSQIQRAADQAPLPGAEGERFRARVAALQIEAIRPAFQRFRDALEAEILPSARPDDAVGLVHLPGGDEIYARLIRRHTTLPLTAAEIHQTGLDELARIHDALRALGGRALGTTDLPSILARLRSDPSLYFDTPEAVEARARAALAAAEAALPRVFGRLPVDRCEVRRVPDYEAPFTTLGYYMPPTPGERSGAYYVNTYAPETRPRHEAEVLAFHEAVPGHHLQIALAMELGELPAFRRNAMFTAYVEGWALYSERLADELGLYSGDIDQLGRLSFDAWRASRLVVDTGLHALGWSRQRAEAFLRENTATPENNVVNEVDRYIVWPGQALAYKTGQLVISRLRAEAEAALGPRFRLPDLHDTLLCAGALPLDVLERRVRAWVAAQG